MLFSFDAKYTEASSTSSVNATVKVSVCGNNTIENGEECERNGDLNGKTCVSLGYTSGTLDCDVSCSFNTSSCVVPSIASTNIAPNDVGSLLAAGYFSKPSSDNITSVSSLTTTTAITINVPTSGGTDSIVLPDNLVITRSDGANFDPTNLTTADVSTSSLSGFSSGLTVDGTVQFGISNTTLEFSTPITLSIYVGTSLNGQTLNVVRSTSASSGWTSDGIVSPATCTVSAGLCNFQATKASYFATTRTASSASNSSSSSLSSSSSSSSSNSSSSTSLNPTSTPIPAVEQPFVSLLPSFLRIFDANGNGKIENDELYNAVSLWVNRWKEFLTEQIAVTNKQMTKADTNRCDLNNDDECNVKDLSVLLFYVER